MTKHIHNPFRSEEGAEVYDLSAGMFFCLVQLYLDFSRRHPSFELSQYYEVYLQTSKNKCVLDATLLPKVGFESFFQAQRYYYDIKTQTQIDESKHEVWHEPLDQLNIYDGFNELLAPASMLYKIYMTYRQLVLKNVTGLPLAWHSFELALLGDEPLMSLAIYPAIEPGQWMKGVLGGLEGYMTFDLKRDLVLESNIRVWGMWIGKKMIENGGDRKKQNKRLNKKLRKQSRPTLKVDHLQSDKDSLKNSLIDCRLRYRI